MKDFKYGAQVHPSLIETGRTLGFRDGGAVKQDTMDTGLQPARRGKDARDAQEEEAGGTPALKPGYKKGGDVSEAAKKGRALSKGAKTGPLAALKAKGKEITGAAMTDKEEQKMKKMRPKSEMKKGGKC